MRFIKRLIHKPEELESDVVFEVPPALNDKRLETELRKQRIPRTMTQMPLCRGLSLEEGLDYGDRGLFRDDVLTDALADRIRHSFSEMPNAELSLGHGGGYYSPTTVLGFEAGCKFYSKALKNADRIVFYPDIPCVVTHPRVQENPYWDKLVFSLRVRERSCFVKELSFRCSPKEISRREAAKKGALRVSEESLYGKDGLAILDEARAAAEAAMKKTTEAPDDLIGYAIVTAKLSGEEVRWQAGGETRIVEAGARAFQKVLEKHGVKAVVRLQLD